MLVLSHRNTTSKGTWYKVEINGHFLHLLSKTELTPGKKYELRRAGQLKLEVVQELREPKGEDQQIHASEKGSRGQELTYPTPIQNSLWNVEARLLLGRLLFEEDDFEIAREKNGFYFQWGKGQNGPLTAGLFIPNSGKYKLLLYREGGFNPESVSEFLRNTQVSSVFQVTFAHLQTARAGLNVIS